MKFVRTPFFIEYLWRLLLNFDLTHIRPMFPLSVLNYVSRFVPFVSHVPMCPAYLCVHGSYVPVCVFASYKSSFCVLFFFTCLTCLQFYVRDVPSVFYVRSVSSFCTGLNTLYYFTCLHFLRVLFAFIFYVLTFHLSIC